MRYLVPMILMMACAPSEDKFEAETIAITCEKTFECTAEEDIAAAQDMGFWPLGSDAAECGEILTKPLKKKLTTLLPQTWYTTKNTPRTVAAWKKCPVMISVVVCLLRVRMCIQKITFLLPLKGLCIRRTMRSCRF